LHNLKVNDPENGSNPMQKLLLGAAATLLLASCAGQRAAHEPPAPLLNAQSPLIVAAVADARRPPADTARDAARHAAETLAFAGARPGARVGELLPGGGYFTRLLAMAVGPQGHLYPVVRPEASVSSFEKAVLEVAAHYPNTTVVRSEFTALAFPEPLDVVFTAQNYHDFHITDFHFGDVAQINRAAFAALKPGGAYVVIDHSAIAGTAVSAERKSLHRIDQAAARREIEAAGFVLDAESDALRNPEDPRTAGVFDPAIRGHTDQFMMRFRKPATH
jgi:predicted methyltransferase